MAKPHKDLRKMASGVGATSGFDRLTTGGLDAISIFVPAFGPLFSGVAKHFVPRDEQTYLRDFAVEVALRIGDLESGMDEARARSAEYLSDAQAVVDSLGTERNRRKRRHYVAWLANSAALDRPDDDVRERMLEILDRLQPRHLALLAVAATPDQSIPGTTDDYLVARLKPLDAARIRLDWADLNAAALVGTYPSGVTMTAAPMIIKQQITAFGREFGAFVEAIEEVGGK